MRKWKMDMTTRSILLAYLIAVLMFLIAGFISPGFDRFGHIGNVLVIASMLGFVGIGQTIVILTGGIDLSIPYVLNASAVFLTGYTALYPHHELLVIVLVLLGGALVGAVNGLGIAYVNIPPLIMTLGMNSVMEGIVLVYTNGTPTGSAPSILNFMVNGKWGVMPVDLIIWLVITVLVSILLAKTYFGRMVYSVGNSTPASFFSGVHIEGTLVSVYALSGLFSALAGMFLTGFSGYSYLGMGDSYLLPSVAMVVIGGASILGGRGKYVGSVAGAIILTVLATILTVVNLPIAFRNILYGLVILIALMLYGKNNAAER